ncbi:amino acid permease [Nocardioides albidus]|uniref:Amino acid permease n=1 Tax=Nocardioides albidus TaxID=1517589 RepID=A0A5C4W1J0_9ACTN|nr:amino acid permease [Nocardioides albidus]TNM42022.1 amino acid permease [Nocardioides albidus]
MGAGPELKAGLSQRQLNMIAIGGVIGAGLFMGSGAVIEATGPASFLTYALAGVLVILIMRMLGEMATANPSTGSFSDYARQAMGGWAGFSAGWLYWYFWVVVVGFEAVAGAEIIRYWVPGAPLWLVSLVLMIAMTTTNLFSVASFGEFEFWFAGIKVATIVGFLVIGTLFVFGLLPGSDLSFNNLTDHGGFFAQGPSAVTAGVVIVIFSMVGAEIATIAAAETPDPAKSVAKATNSVIMRIAVFFIGSIFLLTCILPWDKYEAGTSPYVQALSEIGIPGAADLMNAVALTAVLSCLNSGLYTASRMVFVLAARREAPGALMVVSRSGVPRNAILASSFIGFLCVIAAAISPETVFLFLLNSSGAIILFVYGLIAVSQFVLRPKTDPSKLIVKMWGYPVLSIVAIVGIVAVLLQMALNDKVRPQLLLSLLAWGVILAAYFIVKAMGGSVAPGPEDVPTGRAHRVLVLANETLSRDELRTALRRVDRDGSAEYFVCVPANPIDTGQALTKGAVYVWDATTEAAQQRLDQLLESLRADGHVAEGALGDYRPLRALEDAVATFGPDQIVISTLPLAQSNWLRYDVVDRAREKYAIPVEHVESDSALAGS